VLQNVSHQKVRLFGEAFAKIQEATGISDIDDLVKAFATAEVRAGTVMLSKGEGVGLCMHRPAAAGCRRFHQGSRSDSAPSGAMSKELRCQSSKCCGLGRAGSMRLCILCQY
jgi:hypothetical protein